MIHRRSGHGGFNRLFDWLKGGISLLQDTLQRPATGLITTQRVQQFPDPFKGQQLVVQQIGAKGFEPPPILHIPPEICWPLASVATPAAGTLFFQALMFNNLHRFLRDFDLLTTSHHRSFNLVQVGPTSLATGRLIGNDVVRLVAELKRCPAMPFLSARLSFRFRPLAGWFFQPVT